MTAEEIATLTDTATKLRELTSTLKLERLGVSVDYAAVVDGEPHVVMRILLGAGCNGDAGAAYAAKAVLYPLEASMFASSGLPNLAVLVEERVLRAMRTAIRTCHRDPA